jgi:hypothetical protein
MPNGFAQLGDLLAGGNRAGAQNSFYQGQLQQGQASHLSAQTEEALANAKSSQLKAKAEAQKQEKTDTLADSFFKAGLADSPEKAAALANVYIAGAGNFESLAKGGGELQTQGFRKTLADKDMSLADRLAASSGVQGKVQSYAEGGTPAIQNFNFETALPDDKSKEGFRTYAQPDKIVMGGGVPYSVGRQPGAQPRAVVDPATVAANTQANAGAKTAGTGEAKRMLDLPAATQRLANASNKMDRMSGLATKLADDDKLWEAVGLGQPIAKIPGTQGARIRAQLNTLRSQVGFAVLQDLRDNSKTGGAVGNVSDYEQKLLQNNLASLDENMSVADMREQLHSLADYAKGVKERVGNAFSDTYPGLAPKKPANSSPGTTPGTGKPKSVVQNGHTYVLNEATGEYE